MSTEQVHLDGSTESGSSHAWSTASSLLNIVEHGEHCNEKLNLPWNWKIWAEKPRPKEELHAEFCGFKIYCVVYYK